MGVGKIAGRPSIIRLMLAFGAVYVIWGSTFLAIRYAIETVPPFMMAGTRFLVAGSMLYSWARIKGIVGPTLHQWRTATIAGGFMLLGGNGAVVWAEQRIPSGLAALLIATVPLWMVLLDWLRPGGVRPGGRTALGIVCGFLGMFLLIGPAQIIGGNSVDTEGATILVLGSLSWSIGSLYSVRARTASSPMMGASMQMLAGGTLLFAAAFLSGEWGRLAITTLSVRSLASLAYLIVFGSLVGFTSYIWLLRVTAPSQVATYAYVNPLVAVFLGWLLAGEPLALRTTIAAAVIITAVVIITSARRAK